MKIDILLCFFWNCEVGVEILDLGENFVWGKGDNLNKKKNCVIEIKSKTYYNKFAKSEMRRVECG